ncbi:MAG: sodium-dependent transporter [Lentisphaeria bacterium]|nr:sodium-dependent transporter [Lentisphaeria bacterium]
MSEKRESWSGSMGFILAAAGSAVGLGNIWKFPYITGQNGGGAFVLVYLLCILVIGLPVMLCEITLGRHTQRNPVGAFKALAPRNSRLAQWIGAGALLNGIFLVYFGRYGWAVLAILIGLAILRYGWVVVGVMGVLAGFVILAFYSVVAGWTIGYVVKAAALQTGFTEVTQATDAFVAFVGNAGLAILCHALFMGMCIGIVMLGVQKGIERASKVLMPMLFLILGALIIRGLTLPGAMAGVRFYLSPDFSKITAESVLTALGHAFFSLSLGMGAIITYGSYVRKEENLFTAALSITALDTLVALMAGLAIFPAVFAMGFEPSKGPGLVFMVLPVVFHRIPLGALWATLFFLLLLVAALTSGISLLEVVTAYFVDERKWSRKKATCVFGGVIFALGCLCALSCDKGITGWRGLHWLESSLKFCFGSAPGCFFDLCDHLASNWMLPLGGMFCALFVGWIWGTKKALKEIRQSAENLGQKRFFALDAVWSFFVRFVSPVAVLVMFMATMGWIDFSAKKEQQAETPPSEQVQPTVAEMPNPEPVQPVEAEVPEPDASQSKTTPSGDRP